MGDSQVEDNLADPVWTFDPKANTEGDDKADSGNDDSEDEGKDSQGSDDADDSDNSDGSDDDGEEDEGKTKSDETPKKEEKKEKEKKAPNVEDPKDPPTRGKSKTDFILERKQRQLEKARAAKLADMDKELKEHGVTTDEDDDLDPADEATVEKVIQKKYAPYFEQIEQQRQEAELSGYLSTSDLAKFATPAEVARFKQYAAHPSRAEVPYDEIMTAVLGSQRLMELGAQKEREANKKSSASKVGGSVGGKSGEEKVDFDSMTDKEFEDYQMKVRLGQNV